MAKRGPKGAIPTSFKPGESGNPAGRAKLPEEIKEARKVNKDAVELVLTKLVNCTQLELMEIIQDSNCDMLTKTIARILDKAAETSDHTRLNFIFDRLIGKVKEHVELSGEQELKIVIEDYTGKTK